VKDEKFANIVIAHKRIKNILEKSGEGIKEINENLLFDQYEIELYKSVKETEKFLHELLKTKDYDAIVHLLYLFVIQQLIFFDNVLVMDKNPEMRSNRLALLNFAKDIYEEFADFSQVVLM